MTTEIHRLPGAFSLGNDWPRVQIGNLSAGIWAEWVGDDAVPTDPAVTSGSPLVLPLVSRSGMLNLTGTAGGVPNVAKYADRFKGRQYLSFTGSQSVRTAVVSTPHTGALTVAGYIYHASDTIRDQWLLHTGDGSGAFYGIQADHATYGLRMWTGTGSGTATPAVALSAPLAAGAYVPFVACFDGTGSYLRVGDTTVTGSLTAPGSTPQLTIGRGAGNTGTGWFGRVAHLRVYRRALTTDEASLTATDLRALYG